MAQIQGQRFTLGYNTAATTYDGANEKIDISDFLDVLDPYHHPLLAKIGTNSLRGGPATQVKHEWLEDARRGLSTTSTDADLTGAAPGSSTPTTVTVASGENLKFRASGDGASPAAYSAAAPADIVRLSSAAGEELAVVTKTTSSTAIDIVRNYFGASQAVQHTGTITITIIGSTQVQGLTVTGESRSTIKTPKFNYTQIFETSYKASATEQATDKWTKQNDQEYNIDAEMEIMQVLFERSLLHGKKQAPAASTPQTLGGIREFITTNVANKSGAVLQPAHLEDQLETIWQNGGTDDLWAISNSTQKRRFNQFLDSFRQAAYTDTTFGTKVSRYETDWGNLAWLTDKNMPTDEVLIIDPSRVGFGPLQGRALHMGRVPVGSLEAEVWEIVAEMTAEVRQETCHARIYGLATSGF